MRIDLLGRFRVSVDGEVRTPSVSSRGREVIALLVLAGGDPVPRERLASALWPDSTEGQARTNLRRELHHLKRTLPNAERAIESAGGSLRLRLGAHLGSDVLDVRGSLERANAVRGDGAAELEALRAAVRAYAGDLLPESFASWIEPERASLRAALGRGLRRLVEALELGGELTEAAASAQRALDLDPLDEIACRALMRLAAANGERAAAVHAYHRCARALQRDLGAEPSEPTRALYRDLVARDAGVGEATRDPEHAPSTAAIDAPDAPLLVGRGAALDRLRSAVAAAASGRVRMACVVGEPGIGKTRLVDEVAREAERSGMAVARARAYAAEGQLSYGVVADWLHSPAVYGGLADLDEPWASAIGRLLPELGRVAEEEVRAEPERPAESDEARRRRLFEAVAHAIVRGSRPVLLVLDDLQWCDRETLSLVHYLARYRAPVPLLLMTTARDVELADSAPARELLMLLRQDGRVLDVELGPLDREGIAELIRVAAPRDPAAGDPLAVDRLFRLSEGNPLFALEALRANLHVASAEPERAPRSAAPLDPAVPDPAATASAVPGPLLRNSPRVRAVLSARLAQLRPSALALAQCAATIGRAFSFDVLRAASDLDENDVVQALDEMWRRRIIREHALHGYDFAHDALREAATATLSPARTRLLHKRVAEALELVHAAKADDVSAAIAVHYDHGGVPDRAVRYYRRAAAAAAELYAHGRAVAFLDRALELVAARAPSRERDCDELELHLAQGPSLRAIHGYTAPRLWPAMERAEELATRVADLPALILTLRNQWSARFVAGDVRGTMAIAERLREAAADHPAYEAETHHALAGTLLHLGAITASIRHFEASRRAFDPRLADHHVSVFGSDLAVFNLAWEAHALWLWGLEDRALGAADGAVRRARAVGHAYSEALALAYAAVLHFMRRDRRACAEAADATREVCERFDFAYYQHWGTLLGAWARTRDDPARAVQTIRSALASLDGEGALARRPLYLGALAEALVAADRADEASATLDVAERLAADSGDAMWEPELARLRAACEPAEAEAHGRRALLRAQSLGARPLALRGALTLAGAGRSSPTKRMARELLREVLSTLPDAGTSADRGQAARLLADTM